MQLIHYSTNEKKKEKTNFSRKSPTLQSAKLYLH